MQAGCNRRMPGSFPVFDAALARLITLTQPARALDIGTGAGKVGRLLAEHAPAAWRHGVEIEPTYVDRYALDRLYHRIDVADAATWWPAQLAQRWDLVVIGDCLEHLPKSAGLDLLNALVYRCAWLLLLVPEFVIQDAVDGVAAEAHRSVWSERDLHWHDLFAFDNQRAMTFAVLRGYQPAALSMQQLVEALAAEPPPVHDFDGHSVVRPLALRLVEHPREVAYRPG
jgi:hypothetical protein